MQGQYPGNRGGRPRGDRGFDHADAASARLFLCAGCRAQALICSCCDRGQIYCAGDCARSGPAAASNVPDSATRMGRRDAAAMPRDKVATGRAAKK